MQLFSPFLLDSHGEISSHLSKECDAQLIFHGIELSLMFTHYLGEVDMLTSMEGLLQHESKDKLKRKRVE